LGSIVAGAVAFPVAAVLLLAIWVIRVQIVGPPVDPSPVTVAAALPHSQQKLEKPQPKAEAAVPPQRAVVAEPVAPPAAAPAEPVTTAPIANNEPAADAEQKALLKEQPDASPSAPSIVPAEPVVTGAAVREPAVPATPDSGATSPAPAQLEAAKSLPAEDAAAALPPGTVGERFAPALETTKAPDFTPALSMFATLSAAPPKLGTAYADPSQDASASPAAKPAASQLAEPVPLPRPKPRIAANGVVAPSVTTTGVTRAPTSPLPRPVGSSASQRIAPSPR
jgi:hypothetical protein